MSEKAPQFTQISTASKTDGAVGIYALDINGVVWVYQNDRSDRTVGWKMLSTDVSRPKPNLAPPPPPFE